MIRNVVLACLITLISVHASVAKEPDNGGSTAVKVFLKDGTVGNYYCRNLGNYLDSILFLSTTNNIFSLKKATKIRNSDVDSVVWSYAEKTEEKYTMVPIMVNIDYKDNPRTSPSYPSLVLKLFEGKNVSAYLAYDPWFGYRILYKTHDMERAKGLYKPNTKLKEKDRSRLMNEFGQYPEVVTYLKYVDANGWKINPLAFLKLLDEEIGKHSTSGPKP